MENTDPQPPPRGKTRLPERRSRPPEPAARPKEVRAGLEQRGPLPPPPPEIESDRSLWRALRPLVGLIVVGGGLFLFLRFYVQGIQQAAVETEASQAGIQAIAADLWERGTAPELTAPDLRLRLVIERLKEKIGRGGVPPSVLVVPADSGIGGLSPTHGIVYNLGASQMLLVNVRLEPGGDRLSVVSFAVGPQFRDVMDGIPADDEFGSDPAGGLPDATPGILPGATGAGDDPAGAGLPSLPEKVSEQP